MVLRSMGLALHLATSPTKATTKPSQALGNKRRDWTVIQWKSQPYRGLLLPWIKLHGIGRGLPRAFELLEEE